MNDTAWYGKTPAAGWKNYKKERLTDECQPFFFMTTGTFPATPANDAVRVL